MKNKTYAGMYCNRFHDLKYKYRDDDDKILLLTLALIFLIEFITGIPDKNILYVAPFLEKINIANIDETMEDFEIGIKGKGTLKEPLKTFKNRNASLFNYIKNTTENKGLKRKLFENTMLNDGVSDYLIKLKVETELLEEQNDVSLFVNQMLLNKKFKIWNTQRDDRVRKTMFHNDIDRKKVNIKDWFVVGEHKALFPAHSTLRDYDRFNCRCFLTYE